jgi:hypothetical protein
LCNNKAAQVRNLYIFLSTCVRLLWLWTHLLSMSSQFAEKLAKENPVVECTLLGYWVLLWFRSTAPPPQQHSTVLDVGRSRSSSTLFSHRTWPNWNHDVFASLVRRRRWQNRCPESERKVCQAAAFSHLKVRFPFDVCWVRARESERENFTREHRAGRCSGDNGSWIKTSVRRSASTFPTPRMWDVYPFRIFLYNNFFILFLYRTWWHMRRSERKGVGPRRV